MTIETVGSSDPRVILAKDRTGLAIFRTQLALDRTTLAWIRTTLTMATFGFGLVGFFLTVQQLFPSERAARLQEGAIYFGTVLIILGIGATIVAGISHLMIVRKLKRGELPILSHWPLSVIVALLSAVAGLVGLWLLFDY